MQSRVSSWPGQGFWGGPRMPSTLNSCLQFSFKVWQSHRAQPSLWGGEVPTPHP